jgi:hypothetical protein
MQFPNNSTCCGTSPYIANTNFCGCGNNYPIVPGTNPALQTWNGQAFVVADGSAQNPIRLPFLQVNGGAATYVVGADNNGVWSYYNPAYAGYANNINGGLAGQLPIQTAPSTTGFIYPNNLLVTATGSTTARTLANRFADVVNVKDFGAVGNGSTDDTAAIQAAVNSLPNGGSVLIPSNSICYCASSITIPSKVKLYGEFVHGEGIDYYTQNSQIKLGASATINLSNASGLENLLIIRSGLYTTYPTNPTQASAVVSNFTGTGVTISSANDAYIVGCMLLGHNQAIYSNNSDRVYIFNVKIDSTNGVYLANAFDICRIKDVHCWPFLTANVSGVGNTPNNPLPLQRNGNSFYVGTNCDWSSFVDCFAYGYSIGFYANNSSNIAFIRCQSDYTNPATNSVNGFKISGTASTTTLSECTAIASNQNVYIDTTGGVGNQSTLRIVGCVFSASTAECIYVNNGNVIVDGCSFLTGTVGVSFQSGADTSSVVSCLFNGVTNAFYYANTSIQNIVSTLGNSYQSGSVSVIDRNLNSLAIQSSSVQLNVVDTQSFSAGVGPQFNLVQQFASGYQNSATIKTSLVSATSGNEAVNLVFNLFKAGTSSTQMILKQGGVLNLPNLPTSSAGLVSGDVWRNGNVLNIV